MLKKLFMALMAASLLLLGGCQFEGGYTPTEGPYFRIKGVCPMCGKPLGDDARSLGKGEIQLEGGQKFKGEFFDSDKDGVPDAFVPDAGQATAFGTTDGRTSYELKDVEFE